MNLPEMGRLEALCRPYLERFLKGDELAVDCLLKLVQVAHILDDLVDGDRQPTADEVTGAFWLALVDLPNHPFYQRHGEAIRTTLATGMVNWLAANRLEAEGDERALQISFVLRSSYIDLVTLGALLVGGVGWAAEVTPDIRRWVHGEGLEAYIANLAIEKEARDGVRDGR